LVIKIGDLWIHWYHFPDISVAMKAGSMTHFETDRALFVFHGMIMTRNAWTCIAPDWRVSWYSYQWTWPQTGRNHGLPSSNEAWQRKIHHLVRWFSEQNFHLSWFIFYFYWSLHGVPNFMMRFVQVLRSSEPTLTEDGTFQGSMAFMLERHSTEVIVAVDVTTLKLAAGKNYRFIHWSLYSIHWSLYSSRFTWYLQ